MKIKVNNKEVVRSVYIEEINLGLMVIINTHKRYCHISFDSGSHGPNIEDRITQLSIADEHDWDETIITIIPESEHESDLLKNTRWDQFCKDQIVIIYINDSSLDKKKFLAKWNVD